MPCGAHEIMSKQYSWYSRPRPVNPLTELYIVFLCYVMTKKVFHPGPTASGKTQDKIRNVVVLILQYTYPSMHILVSL